MILADTSVWADHFRAGDQDLARLLQGGHILLHPFIIGELALGHLRKRAVVIADLSALPRAAMATEDEVLNLIETESLSGRGIGYVDVHLLAATRLTPGAKLWTRDRRLAAVAESLSLAFP